MKEIHPPMTGLEAHFEEELGYEKPRKSKSGKRKSPSLPIRNVRAGRESAVHREVEEAMILGR